MKLDKIKKIYTILFLIILSIIFVIPVYGYVKEKIQYQDYEWGIKKNNVIWKLKRKDIKRKTSLFDSCGELEDSIIYTDVLYNNNIEVEMCFTPKSKRLYKVRIGSNNIFNVDLKKILEKKYGDSKKMQKKNDFGQEYEEYKIEQEDAILIIGIIKSFNYDEVDKNSFEYSLREYADKIYFEYLSKKYIDLKNKEYDKLMKEEEDKL